MDRRKIVSRNPLHKQLYSSSQLSKKSISGGLDIVRSVSATNESLLGSRKRKNSEDPDSEDNGSMSSSPTLSNANKKKRLNIVDSSDDNNSGEDTPSPPKRPSPSKKSKDVGPARKKSNRGEENEPNKSNTTPSYIRGVLEALDKSPVKSSQSSNSSIEKYRKMNLRTPLRPRAQRLGSRASADKQTQEDREIEKPPKVTDLKKILPGPASLKEKTPQKVVSDDEDMMSDVDVDKSAKKSQDLRTKKTVLKNKPGPASSKKKTPQKVVTDDEDMMSDVGMDMDKSKESQESRKKKAVLKNLSGPASSKKKAQSKVISDDEMTSDKDMDAEESVTETRDPRTKKNLSGPTSSKKRATQKIVSDDDEMASDAKKKKKKTKERSPERTPVKNLENQRTPERTPVRNQRRIVDSPELSPLRNFGSPGKSRAKENVTQRKKKRTVNQTDNRFLDFVNAAGITLCSGDNAHVASDNPIEVVQKMKDLLSTHSMNEDDVVQSWKSYIEDEENLQNALSEMRIETDEGVVVCSKAVSLSRLLLQVPQLQVEILKSLFSKLIDAVMTTESSDDAPWSLQMLQQFRFLETIVDPEVLVTLIEELLSSSPEWFQREVIVFIPDIVTDIQHRTTAEMLVKIMEHDTDLTNIVLDCIHNLILGKEYKEELAEKVLGLLNNKFDKSTVPAITRFILNSCSTETIALKYLNALRLIDMVPSSKENADECYTHQSFMVNAIKMAIQLIKEVGQAAVAIIKSDKNKAVPLDIILSILLYDTTAAKKKIVEATLLGHIKTGHYKTCLLSSFYSGYKSVAKSFQTSALTVAIQLLQADNHSHVEFGIEWVRYMFISQADTSYRQREIMEKLLNLMASKDKTVKNTLEVLIRMSNDEVERRYLQAHVGFLRSFLEKIDNLHFDEVSTLYHLLHGLCTHSESIANILNDDLFIIMQKQLCSSKVQTKCKGVLGAVMAIKHLACKQETKDDAYRLTRKTINSLKDCRRSETLFYDQLAHVFATTDDINSDFLISITNELEEHFATKCLLDTNTDNTLEPRFGLIDAAELENRTIYFENCKFGAYVPVFFKLLCICNIRTSGDLENINAMLGCPILLPDLEMPELSTADYMIHCINWFRETIGAFVVQKEVELCRQVLKRLETLMNLQGEFVQMVAMLDSRYQPPPCYFNYFPTPQFVRLDLKLSKKGRKGKKGDKKEKDDTNKIDSTLSKAIVLPEWETWEKGSELTVKNPAFFRKMDTKIIHLLDVDMDVHSTQSSGGRVTIAQVCFIIRELLNMFENGVSESFIRDVITLLPKVCKKLQRIIDELRQDDGVHEKEAVRLILCLFIAIFSWKEFTNAKYANLLRDGLRALAEMMSESSALLRSHKDLVVEAYKYFESLADVATQITLAVSLVKLCETLMNHSAVFKKDSKDKQAKMAYGFLCLEWNEPNGAQYKAAVKELLKNWIENEPDPLTTVSSVLEWLPAEVLTLERPQSRLSRMPSVTKINFHLFLKQLFSGLIKGIHVSLDAAERDPERIRTWSEVGKCLEQISEICRSNKYNLYLTIFLRYTTILYQILLSSGMSVLEACAKYQSAEVISIIKSFQKCNRFLRDIFCTARKDKNVALLKLIPLAKSRRERFIYRVKGMLAANNSIGAFWMGTLLNKDLDGEEVDADTSEEATSDLLEDDQSVDEAASEILESDPDDDVDIDGD